VIFYTGKGKQDKGDFSVQDDYMNLQVSFATTQQQFRGAEYAVGNVSDCQIVHQVCVGVQSLFMLQVGMGDIRNNW